jgi:hypothetical protein
MSANEKTFREHVYKQTVPFKNGSGQKIDPEGDWTKKVWKCAVVLF